jgi:uncharacterized protein (TIGR02453 family)
MAEEDLPMRAGQGHFTPALFAFLRELAANNNRTWFLANRGRYEAEVRDPTLGFIGDVGPHLLEISPHLVADPKPVGGSMFRINRDTRFSRDKSPYRTAVGISFRHDQVGRGQPDPGFYLRLAPGGAVAAGGLYHADTATLKRVRDAIVTDPAGWRRATTGGRFAPMFGPAAESLRRLPHGYDPQHPFAEDLRRKDYVWHVSFTEQEACAPDLLDRYLEACRAASPFSRFLSGALGLEW